MIRERYGITAEDVQELLTLSLFLSLVVIALVYSQPSIPNSYGLIAAVWFIVAPYVILIAFDAALLAKELLEEKYEQINE